MELITFLKLSQKLNKYPLLAGQMMETACGVSLDDKSARQLERMQDWLDEADTYTGGELEGARELWDEIVNHLGEREIKQTETD